MKATQVKATDTVVTKNCVVCGKPTSLPYGRTQNYGVLCSKRCSTEYDRHKETDRGRPE